MYNETIFCSTYIYNKSINLLNIYRKNKPKDTFNIQKSIV